MAQRRLEVRTESRNPPEGKEPGLPRREQGWVPWHRKKCPGFGLGALWVGEGSGPGVGACGQWPGFPEEGRRPRSPDEKCAVLNQTVWHSRFLSSKKKDD